MMHSPSPLKATVSPLISKTCAFACVFALPFDEADQIFVEVYGTTRLSYGTNKPKDLIQITDNQIVVLDEDIIPNLAISVCL